MKMKHFICSIHYVTYRTVYKIFTLQHKLKVGKSRNFSKKFNKILNFKVSGKYNNYNLALEINGECCDDHFGVLYEFLH